MLENKKSLWKAGIAIVVVMLIVGLNLWNNSLKPPVKIVPMVPEEEKILFKFEQAGIWKVDREGHRCMVDQGVWRLLPFEKKESALYIIYDEEKTWWKLYDMYSGKLLGEVSSWGVKINP